MPMSAIGKSGPIFLVKPRPVGSGMRVEHFVYDGSLGTLKAVPETDIPHFAAVDDGGNDYSFPLENGWLLEFRRIGRGLVRWAIFAVDGQLYVDMGDGPVLLTDADSIQARLVGCLVLVRLRKPFQSESFLVRFPWTRTWFVDGDTKVSEVEPLCDIVAQLKQPNGIRLWANRWTSGKAIRSLAIRPR